MSEPAIVCPSCKTEIKLTESLAAPLVESTRREYESRLATREAEFAARESTIQQQREALDTERRALEDTVSERLKGERLRIASDEAKKARQLVASDLEQREQELHDLQEVLEARNAKLAEAQAAQADFTRKQRELDDARREIDLTIEQRVEEMLGAMREQVQRETEESLKLKMLEREQTIESMKRQIEELRRRSEQGSQQLQGEVQELELESMLRECFPCDTIEAVGKGEHGGDVVQVVIGLGGRPCGTILWESKRTKNWGDGWLPKLRDDQRAAKADIAILVSQALPKGMEHFGVVDSIWITGVRTAIPLAVALRHSLVEIAAVRVAGEGQQSKMEMIYQYLTGSRFKQRIEAIVEKFTDMQEDLDRERKAMTRLWAKREEQIRGVVEATAGMYGDLQGIVGRPLRQIDGLELKLLPEGEAEVDGIGS